MPSLRIDGQGGKVPPLAEKLAREIQKIEYKLKAKGITVPGKGQSQTAKAASSSTLEAITNEDRAKEIDTALLPHARQADKEELTIIGEELETQQHAISPTPKTVSPAAISCNPAQETDTSEQATSLSHKPPVLKLNLHGREVNGRRKKPPPPPSPPPTPPPLTAVERLDHALDLSVTPLFLPMTSESSIASSDLRTNSPLPVEGSAVAKLAYVVPGAGTATVGGCNSYQCRSPSGPSRLLVTIPSTASSASTVLSMLHSDGKSRSPRRAQPILAVKDWRINTQTAGPCVSTPQADDDLPTEATPSCTPPDSSFDQLVYQDARWDIEGHLGTGFGILDVQQAQDDEPRQLPVNEPPPLSEHSRFLAQMLPVEPGSKDAIRLAAISAAKNEYQRVSLAGVPNNVLDIDLNFLFEQDPTCFPPARKSCMGNASVAGTEPFSARTPRKTVALQLCNEQSLVSHTSVQSVNYHQMAVTACAGILWEADTFVTRMPKNEYPVSTSPIKKVPQMLQPELQQVLLDCQVPETAPRTITPVTFSHHNTLGSTPSAFWGR